MAKAKPQQEKPADDAEKQSPYIVTARKWRPMVFDDVVGQSHVTTTLRNAIGQGRLSHSYIFSGPRGVGKTTTARILAKAINCLHPTNDHNPDNTCEICREITEGRSVNVFEIDGASNRGIDEIRNLREAVRYGPQKGKYKVYIIDEVHMLTKEAFNALLKTLEEPPPYILFIFATTEVHKIPATILSRCQRFDFKRNTIEEIAGRLRFIAKAEGLDVADDALMHIAKQADGSMRDGQSIFDQIVAFGGTSIDAALVEQALNIVNQDLFFRITDLLKAKDGKGCLNLVDELIAQGVDLRDFIQGAIEHFRNLLVVKLTKSAKLIETTEHHKARYMEDAEKFSDTKLLQFIQLANETDGAMRYSRHPRYRLEVCLLLMIKLDDGVEIAELLEKLESLKEQIETAKPASVPQSTLFGSGSFSDPAKDLGRAGVRGSVKASQPLLRPEQRLVPRETIAEPTLPVYDAARTTLSVTGQAEEAITPMSLTLENIQEKWSTFVAEARKNKIAIATILSETRISELRGDKLCLTCPNEFSIDVLRNNKEFLFDLARQVYGTRLRFEGTIGENGAGHADHSEHTSSAPDGDQLQHPIVQALMREIGARQIER